MQLSIAQKCNKFKSQKNENNHRLYRNLHLKLKVFFPLDLFEAESVAGGVKDPGIVVGTLHAGMQTMGEARQLPGTERTGVGQGAVRLALHVALVLPLGEVPEGCHLCGVLHPLDDLHTTL